jgi:hypothetical protein
MIRQGHNREGLPEIELEYWRYFGAHSHDLGLVKKSPPRIVNLNIDKFSMVVDGRTRLALDN